MRGERSERRKNVGERVCGFSFRISMLRLPVDVLRAPMHGSSHAWQTPLPRTLSKMSLMNEFMMPIACATEKGGRAHGQFTISNRCMALYLAFSETRLSQMPPPPGLVARWKPQAGGAFLFPPKASWP